MVLLLLLPAVDVQLFMSVFPVVSVVVDVGGGGGGAGCNIKSLFLRCFHLRSFIQRLKLNFLS